MFFLDGHVAISAVLGVVCVVVDVIRDGYVGGIAILWRMVAWLDCRGSTPAATSDALCSGEGALAGDLHIVAEGEGSAFRFFLAAYGPTIIATFGSDGSAEQLDGVHLAIFTGPDGRAIIHCRGVDVAAADGDVAAVAAFTAADGRRVSSTFDRDVAARDGDGASMAVLTAADAGTLVDSSTCNVVQGTPLLKRFDSAATDGDVSATTAIASSNGRSEEA